MNPTFRKTYAAATAKIAEDLTALLGSDVKLGTKDATLGFENLADFGQTIYQCSSQRLDELNSPAGFLVGEELATRMGATLLMLPADAAMNEDVSAAFDEVANMLTGAWKSAAPPEDGLSNDVSVRDVDTVTPGDLEPSLLSNGLTVVTCTLSVAGLEAPFGFYGTEDWLAAAKSEAEGASSSPLLSSEEQGSGRNDTELKTATAPSSTGGRELSAGDSGASKGLASEAGSRPASVDGDSPDTNRSDGVMMVVDLSGELNEWLLGQMESGNLRFVKPGSQRRDLTERSPVIVFGPNPSVFQALNVEKCIFIQGPNAATG